MVDLKNRGLMRIIRLVAGGLVLWSAVVDQQPMLGILGGLFLMQAILNVGCAAGSCSVPAPRHSVKPDEAH
ncbi:hypothetical protein [Arsenicibacter rosenii]|uniref:DUF2892 domain-containing protein n=1 Tax=Arsenicibacter rosenii TaxID=1750698 RepID=A0A1S2VHV7_9BACT|nr:hypothetical protein [Arsenicibacter rosenii]OIN58319.1 hypothetical protein BLX24_15100 [Arsenicibacter rosenii]